MSKLMFTLALTAAIAAGAGSAFAEEDPIAAAEAKVAEIDAKAKKLSPAVVEQVVVAETAKNPPPTAKEMEKDAGVQTVIKMQEEGNSPIAGAKTKTAEQQVRDRLGKDIKEGRTGDRFVAIVDVSIPTNLDPSKDDSFVLKRDMLTKQLILRMKQKIVEGLGGVFKAEELVETFETNELTTVRAGITVPTKPVFGVTLLAQAESWDGHDYHMAAAAAWSKVLEKSARSILLGVPAAGKSGGDKTVDQWLKDADLSLVCGPRQIVEPDGNRVFLGISARETGINSFRDRANKRAAQISALSYLMMSLYSDVDFVTTQNAAMDVFATSDNKSDTKAKEAVRDKLSQRVPKRVVEGANEIYSTTVTHPVCGKKMIVSVYSVDAKSVAAARVRIEEMFALRYITELANKRALGRHQGYQDKVDEAVSNTEELEKGRKEGQGNIERKTSAAKSRSARVNVPKAEKSSDAKSTTGTFSDTSKISNDF